MHINVVYVHAYIYIYIYIYIMCVCVCVCVRTGITLECVLAFEALKIRPTQNYNDRASNGHASHLENIWRKLIHKNILFFK